ncbi:MAG: hypothetical protein BMS9Abin36_0190 [Gammaproteobacteria bacterium]|nr:MAG: hypothetical protein BMS9Abin36_0190 [Gammaproteobacteria bacterium]
MPLHSTVLSSMARKIQALREQAESMCQLDPEICEVATMVYMGDVYVLREFLPCRDSDGWGCDAHRDGGYCDPL